MKAELLKKDGDDTIANKAPVICFLNTWFKLLESWYPQLDKNKLRLRQGFVYLMYICQINTFSIWNTRTISVRSIFFFQKTDELIWTHLLDRVINSLEFRFRLISMIVTLMI